jgi:hypothetical protein
MPNLRPVRELSDEVAVLFQEVRTSLDACRVKDAGLNIVDFGGGAGELVAAASPAPRFQLARLT